MREQSNARFEAEATHAFCSKHRNIRDLMCGRVWVNVRVAYEQLMLIQHQHLHDRERPNPCRIPITSRTVAICCEVGPITPQSIASPMPVASNVVASSVPFAPHFRERKRLGNAVSASSCS